MKTPASDKSGKSTYLDGFSAASLLKRLHPDSYDVLKSTVFKYRYIDNETGWHLEAEGTIICVDGTSLEDNVKSIRHNDLDRVGCLPPGGIRGDEVKVEEVRKREEENSTIYVAWYLTQSSRDVAVLSEGGGGVGEVG